MYYRSSWLSKRGEVSFGEEERREFPSKGVGGEGGRKTNLHSSKELIHEVLNVRVGELLAGSDDLVQVGFEKKEGKGGGGVQCRNSSRRDERES